MFWLYTLCIFTCMFSLLHFCLQPPTRVCSVFHAVKLNSVLASLDNEPRVLVLRRCLEICPRQTVVIFYGPVRVCDEWGCSERRKTFAKITVLSQETHFLDVQDPALNCLLSLEWPHIESHFFLHLNVAQTWKLIYSICQSLRLLHWFKVRRK